MKSIMIIRFFLIMILLLPATDKAILSAEEMLHPSHYSITSTYDVSSYEVDNGDTLYITRSLTNNESFNIEGLYFSENVPAGLHPLSFYAFINGSLIIPRYENAPNTIYPGYNTVYWIIDDPLGSIDHVIAPGEEIVLTVLYRCLTSGNYFFPLHTSTFAGNGTSFFSVGNHFIINVGNDCCLIKGDADSDSQGPNVSDLTYLVNFLFKGGATPFCINEGDINNDGDILIDDIIYLVNYIFKGGFPPPSCLNLD